MGSRLLAIAAAVTALLALTASPAGAVITMNYPASATTVENSFGLSYEITGDGSVTGSRKATFTYVSGPDATPGDAWILHLADAGIGASIVVQPNDIVAQSNGKISAVTPVNGSGDDLPNGTYEVQMSYVPLSAPLGPPVVSNIARYFTIDLGGNTFTTQPPVLTSPSRYAVYATGSPATVSFFLPENGLSGSVLLTFHGTSSFREMTLATSASTRGDHSFMLDLKNPLASPHVVSVTGGAEAAVPDGMVEVTVSYRDASSNGPATATQGPFWIDTVTRAPILGQPAAGHPYPGAVPVSFSLPEMAYGTPTLTFTGPVTRSITFNSTPLGTTTLSLDRSNLTGSAGVASAPEGNTLPDGTYTVTMAYQDVYANPIATAIVTGVELGPLPVVSTTVTETTTTERVTTVERATTLPGETVTVTTPAATVPTTAAPLRLAATFATRRAGARWRVTASFAEQAGASRYVLSATRGGKTVRGACKSAGRRVTCTATVGSAGTWTLTAAAQGASSAAVATASKTIRLSAR